MAISYKLKFNPFTKTFDYVVDATSITPTSIGTSSWGAVFMDFGDGIIEPGGYYQDLNLASLDSSIRIEGTDLSNLINFTVNESALDINTIGGTPLLATNGGTGSTSFTAGSVIFSNGTILTQDNPKLFYDDTNNRLGLGTTAPAYTLDLRGTGHFQAGFSMGLPTVYSPSVVPGSSSYFAADHIDFRAYSYVVIDAVTYYSETYTSYSYDVVSDFDEIFWNLDIGTNATGVRVFRDYNYTGSFTEYIDSNAFNDNGGIWTPSGVATPSISSYMFLASYNDGATKWSAYGDNKAYFSDLQVGFTTTKAARLDVRSAATDPAARFETQNGGVTAVKVYGAGDGGYITREQLAWYNYNTNVKLGSFSDDGSGVYALFSLGGNSASSGRLFEMDVFDRNLGGDIRTGSFIGEVDQSGVSGDYAMNFTTRTGGGFVYALYMSGKGKIGIAGVTVPTAKLHIAAGSATAGNAPLKFNSGSLLTTAEVGAQEFLTDKKYITITTGAARKEFTLNDIALTSGRVSYNTTSGRQTDSANFTFTGTILGLIGNQTIGTSTNAAALAISGFSLTAANAQSGIDFAGTWNTSGAPTLIKANITNTASGAASLLLDLQVGGVSQFKIAKNGDITSTSVTTQFSGSIYCAGGSSTKIQTFGVNLRSDGAYNWSSTTSADGTQDLNLYRDAAGTLAQRTTTATQEFRVYNTFTTLNTAGEWAILSWKENANILSIGTKKGSSSGTARALSLLTDGTKRWGIGATSGHFLAETDNTYDIGATGATRPRNLFIANNIKSEVAGGGLYIKEGTNATSGTATLVAGSVVVSTTKVTANSRIQLTANGGTITNIGVTYISARTAGTSFTISSLNILDTSDIAWLIIEPS